MNGISGTNSAGAGNRITGLSGLDTESMVQSLMKAEKLPLNSLLQKRTITEWKRDAYRDITTKLKGFDSTFFDIANRSTYLLSDNSVKMNIAKSSNTDYVDASASSDASIGSQTLKVLQLATADTAISSGSISKSISGTVNVNADTGAIATGGKVITVNVDGVAKEILLENYTEADIQSKLQASLDKSFGQNKVTVSYNSADKKLSFGTAPGVTRLTISSPFDPIEISGLSDLGLTSGVSNKISTNSTLSQIANRLSTPMTFSGAGTVDLTINGKFFSFKSGDTLATVFEKINNSNEANATIQYDEITDKITIKAKQMGDGDNLKLWQINGNFFNALGIDPTNPISAENQGKDAKVLLNGTETLVRSSNNFIVNGITYTLKKEHAADSAGETVNVEQDSSTVVKNIKTFVDKYNELIDQLNTKVDEKYDRSYLPLTDEQKTAMKDADVENWEAKAKTGLLRNDSIIQNVIYNMRKAISDTVEGSGMTLKDLGIETGSYSENGRLYLDEAKLTQALKTKPEQVSKFLNGVSPNNPQYSRDSTVLQRKDRYKNSGILVRLSDILDDNISPIRDSDGRKGFLLEKAGISGDASYAKNVMNEELDDFDQKIKAFQLKLADKEENYYLKFSKVEQLMSKMNSQSQWLASQLGGGK